MASVYDSYSKEGSAVSRKALQGGGYLFMFQLLRRYWGKAERAG